MNRHKQAPPCISTANSSTLVLDDTPPYEHFERDTKRMNLNTHWLRPQIQGMDDLKRVQKSNSLTINK